MILKKLLLNNFKQYEELELEFMEGLVGITGKNGSGKSSIFEAILLCLFGDISLDKEHYRSSWADSKSEVRLELEFEIKSKLYRVVRSFRGKVLTHYAELYDQNGVQLASQSKAVSLEITELLGMDKEAFERSIFSGQKELGEISNTTGEKRKTLVRKMLGLDRLDRIQQLVRDDKNSLTSEIRGIAGQLLDEDILINAKKDLQELTSREKSLEEEKKKLNIELDKRNKAYDSAKAEYEKLTALNARFKDMETKLATFTERRDQLKRALSELSKEKSTLIEIKQKLGKQKPLIDLHEKNEMKLKALDALRKLAELKEQKKVVAAEKQKHLNQTEEDISQIEIQLKSLGPKKQSLAKVDSQIKELKIIIEGLLEKHQVLQNRQSAILDRVKERKENLSQIQELGKDATCPTCFQPLVNSYDQTIKRLDSEISKYEKEDLSQLAREMESLRLTGVENRKKQEAYTKELKELNQELAVLNEKEKQIISKNQFLNKIKTELDFLNEEVAKIQVKDFNKDDFEKLSLEIEGFKKDYLQYKQDEGKVNKLPDLEKQVIATTDRLNESVLMIKKVEEDIGKLNFSPANFQEARLKRNQLEVEKQDKETDLKKMAEKMHSVSIRMVEVKGKLDHQKKTEKELAAKRIDQDRLKELDEKFQQFKTDILSKARPSVSRYASELFSRITSGRYEFIEVDDNFDFRIIDNGTSYPIDRFSGGEIDLANLCLRIAISKTIAELSGTGEGLSFLGFDEIFGSQDEERRDEILKALDYLREQYRQIYIISHVESVKENFPVILQVTKDQDRSRVSWFN